MPWLIELVPHRLSGCSCCGFWCHKQYSNEHLYTWILEGDLGVYQSFSTGVNLPLGNIAQCLETSVVVITELESHCCHSQTTWHQTSHSAS